MKVGIIGAGRIGVVHAENIQKKINNIEVKTIADVMMNEKTQEWARGIGIQNVVKDPKEIFEDEEISAVLICSSTDTHAKFVIEAAKAGKNIFCEKPIDHNIEKIRQALEEVEKAGVKMQIGFNRRFDHNHKKVHDIVKSGKIGEPHILKITSRDTTPPTIDYVKRSGGIFYDMFIHDFDMARYLIGSEVEEVYVQSSVLVDEKIGEVGDVDTAIITLKFENGTIGVIDGSRKCVYGYDHRLEVFGSKGSVMDDNDIDNTVKVHGEECSTYDTIIKGMWERYLPAFAYEIEAFVDAIENNKEVPVLPIDGLYPVIIAEAATRSFRENRPVKTSEIFDTLTEVLV